jgi:hypothetical protein
MLSVTLMAEPQPIDPFALRVAPVRLIVPRAGGPLDLDAAIYRYGIDAQQRVTVVHEPAGARFCRDVLISSPRESQSTRWSCAAAARVRPR